MSVLTAKTAWGHPDIEGLWTNRDETNTPLERPDEFKGRAAQDFTAADLAALAKQRQALAAKIAGGIGHPARRPSDCHKGVRG